VRWGEEGREGEGVKAAGGGDEKAEEETTELQ